MKLLEFGWFKFEKKPCKNKIIIFHLNLFYFDFPRDNIFFEKKLYIHEFLNIILLGHVQQNIKKKSVCFELY